jgi:hypothetical protein
VKHALLERCRYWGEVSKKECKEDDLEKTPIMSSTSEDALTISIIFLL